MTNGQPVVCPGPMRRRDFLRLGTLGLGGLGLADLLRLRARAAGGTPVRDTACIFVSLFGGPSHLETYDPKPDAPAEYRGPFRANATKVPGMQLCELLPRHARVADKFALIRSCSHDLTDHFDAAQQVLTGRRPPRLRLAAGDPTNENTFPDVASVCKRVRPPHPEGLPSYVAMPRRFRCGGPAYLGPACDPFVAGHVHPGFRVPQLDPDRRGVAGTPGRSAPVVARLRPNAARS
jgi:hypothetical protein